MRRRVAAGDVELQCVQVGDGEPIFCCSFGEVVTAPKMDAIERVRRD